MTRLRNRSDVIDMMRRAGLADRISEAREVLPDVIDLDRVEDEQLLAKLGLNLDWIVDHLGGSAW